MEFRPNHLLSIEAQTQACWDRLESISMWNDCDFSGMPETEIIDSGIQSNYLTFYNNNLSKLIEFYCFIKNLIWYKNGHVSIIYKKKLKKWVRKLYYKLG